MNRCMFAGSRLPALIVALASAGISSPAGAGVFQTVTNNADAGPGSLRAAINAANANSGTIINFSIGSGCGPHVIALTTPLPNITAETHIEGYSQPGASVNDLSTGNDANICVILDGTSGGVSDGFTVPASVADGVTVSVIGLAFSGFSHAAINLRGGSHHVVSGNHIGGQVNGVSLDPVGYGIILGPGVHDTTIGGDYTNYALRNIIGDALNNGINIDAPGASAGAAHDNAVIDNYIGIGYSGSQTSFNRGNGVSGISIGGYNNDIERNYINFNVHQGIHLTGPDAAGNIVDNNFIGYHSGRSDAGNGIGVLIDAGSHDNGLDFNAIWQNVGAGVQIMGDSPHNYMFDNQYNLNGGLGIDLGGDGVTANNNDSTSVGLPNRDQNFPLLASAGGGHFSGKVSGTLTSTPGDYYVEVFTSNGCDASGYGQGEFSVAYQKVTIPNITVMGQGSISFSLSVHGYFLNGFTTMTAVVSDSANDTSEFSPCINYVDDTIFTDSFEPQF
jgi:hypothetical protein